MLPRQSPGIGHREVAVVLLGSGGLGFLLGAAVYPRWQDALEPAQVLAGLVAYPPDNPLYLYSVRTWTVLHQASAVLLSWGVSDRVLTLAVTGVIGMLSYQALGLVVLALGRDVPLAILSPPFIQVTRAFAPGVSYPVYLMAQQTYGVVGQSWLVLAVALIGVGRPRWGLLLLGFAPAVHPVLGAWGLAIAGLSWCTAPRAQRAMLLEHSRALLAGLAGAAVLAAGHYLGTGLPQVLDVSAYFEHWDLHRQPFPLLSDEALTTYAACAAPACFLWRLRSDLSGHAQLLLRMLISASVLGAVLSASYWLGPSDQPSVIAALMPSRLLNLSALVFLAMLVGVSARYPDVPRVQVTLAGLVVLLVALAAWARHTQDEWARMTLPGMILAGGTAILMLLVPTRAHTATSGPAPWRAVWAKRATCSVLAGTLAALVTAEAVRPNPVRIQFAADDPLMATLAAREGMLLTASDLHMIQLRTRRPVLLDTGALDTLIYVPDARPHADRILRRVYGTDLATVRREHASGLDAEQGKGLWEARTTEEWEHLAGEFGVTDVVTPRHWSLHLPVVASSETMLVYTIPRGPDGSDSRH